MRLLLVEDETRLARLIARGLVEEGHAVDTCERGADAMEQGLQLSYDVAILDWSLPDVDGLTVLRTWRQRGSAMPVLMLTARSSVPERVAGLRAGADDYLAKPFDFEELLARLEALHRRTTSKGVGVVGDVTLDSTRRTLARGTTQVELTAREFAVMRLLVEHAGDVCTRTQLLQGVWGQQFAGEANVVDVYVGYLRKKLADTGTRQVSIATVRGIGFRLETVPAR